MNDPNDQERTQETRDARLHAWLDGEMSPEERSRFAQELAADPVLRSRLEALVAIERHLHGRRPTPPTDLAERIITAVRRQANGTEVMAAGIPEDTRQVASDSGADRLASMTGSKASDRHAGQTGRRFLPGLLPGGWWRVALRWAWMPAATAAALALVLWAGGTGPAPSPPMDQISERAAPGVRHDFRLQTGDADQVCLVGNFNQWKICVTPLERTDEGIWRVTVQLPPGRHEYMFVVDGQWLTDPEASVRIDDGFGNQNAVIFL